MYLCKLKNVFVWIEVNLFPRGCYENHTLAGFLFGLSSDKIYQVSFLQYSACNEADSPFLPFSLQMQDHLAELSVEQQFANYELVFKYNYIQDFPSALPKIKDFPPYYIKKFLLWAPRAMRKLFCMLCENKSTNRQ